MSCILTVIESKNKEIKNSALELLSEARKISSKKNLDNKVIIIGEYEKNNSTQINEFGINSLLIGSTDKISKYSPELYRDSLLHTINELKPEIILFSGSSIGKDLAPRIAANTEYSIATDCIAITVKSEGLEVKRPIYAGKIIETVILKTKNPTVILLKINSFNIKKQSVNEPNISIVQNEFKENYINQLPILKETIFPERRTLDISEASIIVSGGRGMKVPKKLTGSE